MLSLPADSASMGENGFLFNILTFLYFLESSLTMSEYSFDFSLP